MELDRLVGTWVTEASVDGTRVAGSTATFSWSDEAAFLVVHDEGDPPGPETPQKWIENAPFPVFSIIGRDDTTDELTMLYSDARGVRRIYRMTLVRDTWRIWRDAPGFNQRFSGTFDADGRTIRGAWEMSKDGETWSKDFDLVYTKR